MCIGADSNFLCIFIKDFYAKGDYIIRQGATGDTFFIINSGTVSNNSYLIQCAQLL